MHPLLYKSLIATASFFLVLALLVMPHIRPGSPEYYANITGIILLVLFIVFLTIIYKKQARIELPEEFS